MHQTFYTYGIWMPLCSKIDLADSFIIKFSPHLSHASVKREASMHGENVTTLIHGVKLKWIVVMPHTSKLNDAQSN